jgi:hypothetical protein
MQAARRREVGGRELARRHAACEPSRIPPLRGDGGNAMRKVLVVVALVASGCVTSFTGRPTIQAGPEGCKAVCDGWGMELAGMVQMGEYSNGCVCAVKGKPMAAVDAAGGALPAVAGVWMAMQARQSQAAQGANPPAGSRPIGPHSPTRPWLPY